MPTDNRSRNIIIAIIVLLLAACCCTVAVVGTGLVVGAGSQAIRSLDRFELGTVTATTTFSRSFDVDEPAELTVDLDFGSLAIIAAESDVVQVDATATAFGLSDAEVQEVLNNLQLTATATGSSVEVVGKWKDSTLIRGRSPQIDVRITVPAQTDIEIDMGAGSVEITGVEGNADITADVGQVTLRDLDIPETLTVESGVAEISFYGPLREGSEYRFTSDVGAIQLWLPEESRFAIDAASDLGTVVVEFDVVGETARELTGATVQGVVGGGSDTTLYLRSDVGAIYVREQ